MEVDVSFCVFPLCFLYSIRNEDARCSLLSKSSSGHNLELFFSKADLPPSLGGEHVVARYYLLNTH